jgi:hypothetical protein
MRGWPSLARVVKSAMVGFTKRVITEGQAEKKKGAVARTVTGKRKYPKHLVFWAIGQKGKSLSYSLFVFMRGALGSRLPAQDMRGLSKALA